MMFNCEISPLTHLCTRHSTFTPEEEEAFLALSRDPNVYERIVQSIAPSIYGSESVFSCHISLASIAFSSHPQTFTAEF